MNIFIENLKNEYKEHRDSFYETLAAIVLTIVALILSCQSLLQRMEGGVKVFTPGTVVFFGGPDFPFSPDGEGIIRLFCFALPILGILLSAISYLYRPLKGMSSVFLLVSGILIIVLPSLLENRIKGLTLTTYGYSAMILLFISAVLIFMSEYKKEVYTVGEIAENALLIALAIVGQFIKVPLGATGGSFNLQIIPLLFLALRNNSTKTFVGCGIIFGMITCLLDGYGLQTYPFEYMIAFGSLCIVSAARPVILKDDKPSVLGGIILGLLAAVATTIRFFAASIDSVFLYHVTWPEAFVYNALYVYLSGIAAIVVIEILYIKPLFILNKKFPPADYKLIIGEVEDDSPLHEEIVGDKIEREVDDIFSQNYENDDNK